jgi:hypothetical protein
MKGEQRTKQKKPTTLFVWGENFYFATSNITFSFVNLGRHALMIGNLQVKNCILSFILSSG